MSTGFAKLWGIFFVPAVLWAAKAPTSTLHSGFQHLIEAGLASGPA